MRNAPGILTFEEFQSREFLVSMNTIISPASNFRLTSSIVIRSGAGNFHAPLVIFQVNSQFNSSHLQVE